MSFEGPSKLPKKEAAPEPGDVLKALQEEMEKRGLVNPDPNGIREALNQIFSDGNED